MPDLIKIKSQVLFNVFEDFLVRIKSDGFEGFNWFPRIMTVFFSVEFDFTMKLGEKGKVDNGVNEFLVRGCATERSNRGESARSADFFFDFPSEGLGRKLVFVNVATNKVPFVFERRIFSFNDE